MEPFKYDDYWTARGKKFLDDTLPNLKKAFERYRAYLNGLSLTTFVGGVTLESFLQTTNIILYLGFIVPVILFQGAKLLFDTDLSTPAFTRIDPRSPKRVEAAYVFFLNNLRKKLNTGRQVVAWVTLVGIICVPTSLYLSLKERAELSKPEVAIDYYGDGIAHIKGRFPGNDSITIEFFGKYTKKDKKEDGTIKEKTVDTILAHTAEVDAKKELDWQYHITANKDFKPNRILVLFKKNKNLEVKIKELK